MKTLVIYESKYGNTAIIARALSGKLSRVRPTELWEINDIPPSLKDTDLLLLGGPTQIRGMTAAMRAFIEQIPFSDLNGMKVAAFDTRLHGLKFLTGSAANHIAKELQRKGATLVVEPESFLVTAAEGPLAEGEVERATAWASSVLETASMEVPQPTGQPV